MPTSAQSPTQQIRAVLAGCGGISAAWIRAVAEFPNVEIVALIDLDRSAAEARAAEHELAVEIGTDLAAIIKQVQPDVLFDCTTPVAHVGVDEIGLRAGCHVLTEKPLATSMQDARRIVRTATETGRIHAVMQNRRYVDGLRRFREVVQSGTIGTPTALYADFFVGAHFEGFRKTMDHVLLIDMAIHTFDAARFVLDARPVSTHCHEWNPTGSWYRTGASAIATFEMQNGTRFNYRGSWCSEGLTTSWESEWRAIGTDGSASWDGFDRVVCEVPGEKSGLVFNSERIELRKMQPLECGGHAGCIREFIDVVLERRSGNTTAEPTTVSHDNIYSLAMSLGAAESAESNTWVGLQLEDR